MPAVPELEARLDEPVDQRPDLPGTRPVNTRYVSTTDPDAAIVRRGKPRLQDQTHRAVDSHSEVITATHVSRGGGSTVLSGRALLNEKFVDQ